MLWKTYEYTNKLWHSINCVIVFSVNKNFGLLVEASVQLQDLTAPWQFCWLIKITWKHSPRDWYFAEGRHRPLFDSPRKGTLMWGLDNFLWCRHEAIEQTEGISMISGAMTFVWCRCNNDSISFYELHYGSMRFVSKRLRLSKDYRCNRSIQSCLDYTAVSLRVVRVV